MKNLLFYALTVGIWGSTWYAIKFQLNGIPTQVSVTYRFALATLLLWGWCYLRRMRLLSLAGTISASFGNLLSARLQDRSIPVVAANAFGMLYGTVALLAYAVLSGAKFNFDFSAGYVGSLLYLALFGSVVAFGSYLTLVGRIGADRAAYVTILFPIVALFFSIAFEGYRLHWLAVLGIVCVLAGNGIVMVGSRGGRG
jgi:drug/metabolite transporter (DMT)-like permease